MSNFTEFKIFLLKKGIATGTVEKHIASISNLLNTVPDFQNATLEQHLFEMLTRESSPGHLNNLVAALRHYGDFTGVSYRNIKYFKVFETDKGVMSDEEITALYSIMPQEMEKFLSTRTTGERKKINIDRELFIHFTFFFFILAHTGFRPSELVRLRVTQVDFGIGVIRLDEKTKTGEYRTVAMSDMLKPRLEEYIKKLEGNRLFPDWGRHQWKHQFNNRIKYLGIKREKITTYSLRHSWITSLFDNEANVFVVSEMAGWKDINRAKTYYKMTTKSKKKAIKKLSLSSPSLSYYDRLKIYREEERKLRENLARSPEEERKMLQDALNLV